MDDVKQNFQDGLHALVDGVEDENVSLSVTSLSDDSLERTLLFLEMLQGNELLA